jgi:recombination protein RecA
VVEIFGPESSGKTTLALQVVAQAQKLGGMAAYIDAEHAMDPGYARALGVDVEKLVISQPDSGEQALEITERLVRSGALDIIVVDSVAALVPQAEIEGEMGDQHMGLQARLMSQALRKLTSSICRTQTCLVFINQIRHKIGVMFGNPETTTGGLALKFYASARLDIRRIENLKQGDEVYGARCRVKVVKNKVAAPYRQAVFDMIHGHGVSREGCILDMGVESGIIEKSGAWLLYKGERLGQGRDNAKATLQGTPALADELEKALREKYLKTEAPAASEAAPAKAEPAPEVREAPRPAKVLKKAHA